MHAERYFYFLILLYYLLLFFVIIFDKKFNYICDEKINNSITVLFLSHMVSWNTILLFLCLSFSFSSRIDASGMLRGLSTHKRACVHAQAHLSRKRVRVPCLFMRPCVIMRCHACVGENSRRNISFDASCSFNQWHLWASSVCLMTYMCICIRISRFDLYRNTAVQSEKDLRKSPSPHSFNYYLSTLKFCNTHSFSFSLSRFPRSLVAINCSDVSRVYIYTRMQFSNYKSSQHDSVNLIRCWNWLLQVRYVL